MGMTIDEAIKQINECKAYKQCDMEKDSEAFEYAIDTMRKYQKIEEIVKSKTTRLSYDVGFEQIRKVVEDGKID